MNKEPWPIGVEDEVIWCSDTGCSVAFKVDRSIIDMVLFRVRVRVFEEWAYVGGDLFKPTRLDKIGDFYHGKIRLEDVEYPVMFEFAIRYRNGSIRSAYFYFPRSVENKIIDTG